MQPDHADIIRAIQASEQRTAKAIAELVGDLDDIKEGFPGGDPGAHRRYHESIIEWREARTKFIREITAHLAKYGLLAGTGWLLYGLWVLFKMEVSK